MKYIITLFLFAGLLIKSQAQSYETPDKDHYSYGFIYLNDDAVVKAKDINITGDSLEFTNKKTLEREKYSLVDIDKIKVKTGTRAVAGIIVGVGIPLILLSHDMANGTNNSKSGNIGSTVFLFGAVLGGIALINTPVMKTYEVRNKPKNTGLGYNILLGPKAAAISIAFRF